MEIICDTTFVALADPVRRHMIVLLAKQPRAAGVLATQIGISAPATSKHLKVLRQAGLVEDRRSARDNRVRVYRLREAPLRDLKSWLDRLERDWGAQLSAFKAHAEARVAQTTKTKPQRSRSSGPRRSDA